MRINPANKAKAMRTRFCMAIRQGLICRAPACWSDHARQWLIDAEPVRHEVGHFSCSSQAAQHLRKHHGDAGYHRGV